MPSPEPSWLELSQTTTYPPPELRALSLFRTLPETEVLASAELESLTPRTFKLRLKDSMLKLFVSIVPEVISKSQLLDELVISSDAAISAPVTIAKSLTKDWPSERAPSSHAYNNRSPSFVKYAPKEAQSLALSFK